MGTDIYSLILESESESYAEKMTYEKFEHSHLLRMDMYKLTHMPSRTNSLLSMDLRCMTYALLEVCLRICYC